MALKKIALLLLVPVVALAAYGISGCVHGEHDDTPLTIMTTSLPPGMSGSAYSYTLEAIGGKIPYTWSIEAGGATLPPGLYLSESGNLSGTPTTDGSYSFTMVVTDSDKDVRIATKNLTIVIYPLGEVTITSATVGPVYVTQALESQLQAVGGVTPYLWSIVLPATQLAPGLYLSDSGNITGTPTKKGVYTVEVRVDEQGATFDTRNITTTVYDPQEELSITTTSPLPDWDRTTSYSLTLDSSGGGTSHEWDFETGSAPRPGDLALSLQGDLTGSAYSPVKGEYSFSVQVTDAADPPATVTKIFKITVK